MTEADDNLRKIDHVVVLMMENRSFDHMLGFLTIEQGREAARLAAMNALAAVLEHVSNLKRIKKLAKVNIYLAATPQFTDHAVVADGASDFFAQIFGQESGHARMVSGVASLPKGTPVVVETIFEIN